MMRSAMLGACTLIMAISCLAALLPTVSIMSAALSQQAGHVYRSARATRSSQTECSRSACRASRSCSRASCAALWPRRWCACSGGYGPARGDPARSRSRDLRPAACCGRDAHVLEFDFHMAVRRIVIAEHGEVAQDVHAGRIHRHQDHRLRGMAARREIGLAHHDRDLAARIAHAR